MDNMDITMRGENAVPIVITHRTVKRAPQILRTKKFIGILEGLKTLVVKAIEVVEDSFWTEEREIKDMGESRVVHYALDIENDGTDSDSVHLVATRLDGNSRPACGAHFEVVRVDEPEKPDDVIRLPSDSKATVLEGRRDEPVSRAKLIGERPVRPSIRAPRNNNRQESTESESA